MDRHKGRNTEGERERERSGPLLSLRFSERENQTQRRQISSGTHTHPHNPIIMNLYIYSPLNCCHCFFKVSLPSMFAFPVPAPAWSAHTHTHASLGLVCSHYLLQATLYSWVCALPFVCVCVYASCPVGLGLM